MPENTTNIHQKASSRVLAPPGGRSTIPLFGGNTANYQPQLRAHQANASQQQQPQMQQQQQMQQGQQGGYVNREQQMQQQKLLAQQKQQQFMQQHMQTNPRAHQTTSAITGANLQYNTADPAKHSSIHANQGRHNVRSQGQNPASNHAHEAFLRSQQSGIFGGPTPQAQQQRQQPKPQQQQQGQQQGQQIQSRTQATLAQAQATGANNQKNNNMGGYGSYDINQPSSRVLKPPGGGSSNIFGSPTPQPTQQRKPQQQRQQPQQQQQKQQGQNVASNHAHQAFLKSQTSNIFGGPAPQAQQQRQQPQQQQQRQQGQQQGQQGQQQFQSRTQATRQQAAQMGNHQKNNNMGGYGSYDINQPSSRVLKPPGGGSSNIFG